MKSHGQNDLSSGPEWMPLYALARHMSMPEPTARRYLNRFPEFIRTKRQGRAHLVHVDCVPIFQRIAGLFAQNHSREQVAEVLAREFTRIHEIPVAKLLPAAPVTRDDVATIIRDEASRLVAETLKTIADQKAEIEELKRKVAALEASRSLEEPKLQDQPQEASKGFWARWFGGD